MAHPVDGETLSGLHMRGQDLYRQKNYEAALQCFTEVGASWPLSKSRLTLYHQSINRDAHAPASVLDNRAATYTKLGNLRAALKDARQMIQQEKGNCSVLWNPPASIYTLGSSFQGYLRTGKILQLMGHHKIALDLYKMGTCKVLPSDPNFMVCSHSCLLLDVACANY